MLKLYTANYISMQENLTNSQKVSLLKQIKESSDDEIKSLLVTGNFEVTNESVEMFDTSPVGVLIEDLLKSFGDVVKAGTDVAKTGTDLAKAGVDVGKEVYKQSGGDLNKAVELLDKAVNPSAIDRAIGFLSSHQVSISAVALAALLATASYKIYKNYLSASSKSCSKFSGESKKQCMKEFDKRARQVQINTLQKSLKACKSTKNPGKCSQKVTQKIYSLKRRMP